VIVLTAKARLGWRGVGDVFDMVSRQQYENQTILMSRRSSVHE